MRGAHLADLHLGFRAYASTIGGRNAREVDVEEALDRTVEQIVAARPDLVTIAGDVFHHPRPSMYAQMAFLRAIRRILEETSAVVIVLVGNHDAGRTIEVLTPVVLATVFRARVHVVSSPERIRFRVGPREIHPGELDGDGYVVSVACFPFTTQADGAAYRLGPDPDADVNVLLMHAAVRGSAEGDTLPYFYGGAGALDIGRAASEWDVVAVGDYHEFTRLHPTALAFYSGSIERTSSNIWQERQEKGWVLVDTEARTLEFKEVPTRPVVDVHTLETFDVDAQILNLELASLATDPELAGAIVRLKVDSFPRAERGAIDQDLVRKLRQTCLHFQLDLSYDVAAEDQGPLGTQTATLADEAAAWDWGDDEVRALALRHLGVEAAVEDLEEVAA